ncbi:DUF1684 domain-containing protein [Pedobacter changchengzhani]|uniref:DUF1684 domain-containing protein n=1 Tax=Pedobacter changchengzhani TaxID=2529274 RepID=A0A4R5MLG8_9SPHI|nr:DUF1684 domain-containing protein [Pedobacter changchengzhani]TDG36534.1 DUF1684 domain-containing protein [Pedobacter changchengzhani]
MKFIIILLLITSSATAQTFKAEIEQHRTEYKAAFLKEDNSPLKQKDLQHLNFFDADSTYKVSAKVQILQNKKVFKMPTYNGTSKNFYRCALINFILNDQPITMTLYKSVALANNPMYKNLLFLPFTDQTNGNETYGGGRYIDLSEKEIKNDKIEIDFNKAYNPYCAYGGGYNCPAPPEDNNLQMSITAGEKIYTGGKKH